MKTLWLAAGALGLLTGCGAGQPQEVVTVTAAPEVTPTPADTASSTPLPIEVRAALSGMQYAWDRMPKKAKVSACTGIKMDAALMYDSFIAEGESVQSVDYATFIAFFTSACETVRP